MDGAVDDARIYARCLSSSEALALAEEAAGTDPDDPASLPAGGEDDGDRRCGATGIGALAAAWRARALRAAGPRHGAR